MAFGTPNFLFRDIYEITPDFFTDKGISFVLCDIDNTLVTYDDEEPTPALREWLEAMKGSGITFAFVSNNHPPRVSLFNRSLGYPYICDAKKPLPFSLNKMLKKHGISKKNAAMLGDQVLTDSMAAAFMGILSVNVPPIKDRTGLFFRFKRRIEVLFMHSYWKKHPDQKELRILWYNKTGNKLRKKDR